MKVFAMTVAYNEPFYLPRWVTYYSSQVGVENLFIVDHGSTDLSTLGLGRANIIRVPRDAYDEVQRVTFASHFHTSLLSYYDAGFVSDADEIVIAHPERFKSLLDFAKATPHEAPTCVGLELFHIRTREPMFQPTLPILSQRRHVVFSSWMCKRSFSAVPVRFGGGFHTSNLPVAFDRDLFLIHLKNFDFDHRFVRQEWSARLDYAGDFGVHARRPVDYVHELFDALDQRVADGHVVDGIDFDAEIRTCETRTRLNPSGEYDFNMDGGIESPQVHILPASFRGLV